MSHLAHTNVLYTPSQIAVLLQVKRRTVYGWIKNQKLAAIHAGNRVRIHQQALDEFLAKK